MRHLMYFPSYVPAPKRGNWLYIVAYAYEQSFHSCGTVERTGRGDFNNETFVTYVKEWRGQIFSDRPIKVEAK